MESFISLALAVILFRTFAVEGYMISTGSMAPSLLGYHKRVTCPSCRFEFPYGVAFDESIADSGKSTGMPQWAACPNCGQDGVDVRLLPRNEGDQLLVQKDYYSFVPPNRWEVVVFRNPDHPTDVYVKRVVGLPGEAVQVRHGDVYINGRLHYKTLAAQRAVRILVYDDAFSPLNDKFWKSRWFSLGASSNASSKDAPAWNGANGVYRIHDADGSYASVSATTTADDSTGSEIKWLAYRHWIRSGGGHRSHVSMDAWPQSIASLDTFGDNLTFLEDEKAVVCMGALLPDVAKRLMVASQDLAFRRVIYDLYLKSHIAPVSDDYGYNRTLPWHESTDVTDLMCEFQLEIERGQGEVRIQMRAGDQVFSAAFDVEGREVNLFANDDPQPVRSAEFVESWLEQPVQIEMSLFDRQVILAVDGEPVFTSYPFQISQRVTGADRLPIRLGARGLDVQVTGLRVYRDVYYTGGKERHGVKEPYQLGDNKYFMLGDNSPVSLDSRSWATAAVSRDQLLGKPLLVHLPSKPGRFRWGKHEINFRIPDLSRMRFVR